MASKSPFIKSYLEEHNNCEEVQKIIDENECNSIAYIQI